VCTKANFPLRGEREGKGNIPSRSWEMKIKKERRAIKGTTGDGGDKLPRRLGQGRKLKGIISS